jgi:hypothetical protein
VRVLRDLARQFQFDAMKEIIRKAAMPPMNVPVPHRPDRGRRAREPLLLHDALDEAGYTVLVATNGEALQRARQSLPDVILLDALMPGMDGFEVARR